MSNEHMGHFNFRNIIYDLLIMTSFLSWIRTLICLSGLTLAALSWAQRDRMEKSFLTRLGSMKKMSFFPARDSYSLRSSVAVAETEETVSIMVEVTVLIGSARGGFLSWSLWERIQC